MLRVCGKGFVRSFSPIVSYKGKIYVTQDQYTDSEKGCCPISEILLPRLYRFHRWPDDIVSVAYQISINSVFFKFKRTVVLIITYKALHGLFPKYISDLLTLKRSSGILRSNYQDSLKLETPTFKTKNYGGKAFSVCAPLLWNDLPRDLRNSPSLETFKRGLKTYLFNQ